MTIKRGDREASPFLEEITFFKFSRLTMPFIQPGTGYFKLNISIDHAISNLKYRALITLGKQPIENGGPIEYGQIGTNNVGGHEIWR
ncbi:MAG: hypothetical protein PHN75_15975 [Syntrophales bacterium]|nr:hypothetical protein [Syntrophales bacterium]